MTDRALLPFDLCDRVAFHNCGASFVCNSSQSRHEFSGIERSSRNFFHHAQGPGIVPLNRGGFQGLAAPNFKSAGQREIAIDLEFSENTLEAAQNISEAGQIARGGFRKRHPAGTATSSRADAVCFEYG